MAEKQRQNSAAGGSKSDGVVAFDRWAFVLIMGTIVLLMVTQGNDWLLYILKYSISHGSVSFLAVCFSTSSLNFDFGSS